MHHHIARIPPRQEAVCQARIEKVGQLEVVSAIRPNDFVRKAQAIWAPENNPGNFATRKFRCVVSCLSLWPFFCSNVKKLFKLCFCLNHALCCRARPWKVLRPRLWGLKEKVRWSLKTRWKTLMKERAQEHQRLSCFTYTPSGSWGRNSRLLAREGNELMSGDRMCVMTAHEWCRLKSIPIHGHCCFAVENFRRLVTTRVLSVSHTWLQSHFLCHIRIVLNLFAYSFSNIQFLLRSRFYNLSLFYLCYYVCVDILCTTPEQSVSNWFFGYHGINICKVLL